MARIEKTVFISYRRADVYAALAVYQDLKSKGYDVFFDYTSIPSGDFEQIIVSNIKARAHFLLILTPTALDRCNEPGDWLRREIETAIDEERNIIPLFFKGFKFGSPSVAEKLTGKLEHLSRFNGLNVHEDFFQAAMDRLSGQFLSVPLDAILQPYSTRVGERVKEEQIAAENALQQKWEDIKEILKPAKGKIGTTEQDQFEKTKSTPFNGSVSTFPNIRLYGVGVGILLLVALGLAGINAWMNRENEVTPTITSHVFTPSSTDGPAVTDTVTPGNPTSTPAPDTPTVTITPAPTLGIGSTMISPIDNMTLVYVPAGEFTMGLNNDEEDNPAHEVYLDAFWIDQTEVTNEMYAACVQDNKHCAEPRMNTFYLDPDFSDHPVVFVHWEDAKTYCEWAGRRLPREAEWEKAARGTDQRIYPWGTGTPTVNLANYGRLVNSTTVVYDYREGSSPYGALNMAGNVWEWVADFYELGYYNKSRSSNPSGPLMGSNRVMRGGSWIDLTSTIRVVHRYGNYPLDTSSITGFRCALSAE